MVSDMTCSVVPCPLHAASKMLGCQLLACETHGSCMLYVPASSVQLLTMTSCSAQLTAAMTSTLHHRLRLAASYTDGLLIHSSFSCHVMLAPLQA